MIALSEEPLHSSLQQLHTVGGGNLFSPLLPLVASLPEGLSLRKYSGVPLGLTMIVSLTLPSKRLLVPGESRLCKRSSAPRICRLLGTCK